MAQLLRIARATNFRSRWWPVWSSLQAREPSHHHPQLPFVLALGGLYLWAAAAGHHFGENTAFAMGLLLGQTRRSKQEFFFFLRPCAHLLMWICVLFWTSCVQKSGGSSYGAEMTLDPDHMSRSPGSSPTLPAAWPLCSSQSLYLPTHQHLPSPAAHWLELICLFFAVANWCISFLLN